MFIFGNRLFIKFAIYKNETSIFAYRPVRLVIVVTHFSSFHTNRHLAAWTLRVDTIQLSCTRATIRIFTLSVNLLVNWRQDRAFSTNKTTFLPGPKLVGSFSIRTVPIYCFTHFATHFAIFDITIAENASPCNS